jgi:Pyruvate/2-oxoacid:ferredoxin oxidoreductase gamma subunit
MSDPTLPTVPATVAAVPAGTSVSFSWDDAISIAEALGTAATALNPAAAGAVAAATGIAALLRNTIIPAIQRMHDTQLSVAQQAQLAADSAVERAKVGAPAATIN